ncbi:hypothetical protein F441_18052 [Phytophthora nicotianae CJ01A1]|uniref:CCHC-type domain-containing protein n=1 Tax=Phytophthora nicotianae CJ01A1 TaxID=1317063 RepID=W2W416_PHYNI|nr:hypothetical protein F441_18052 [Phytophthora nicotianae CJ01A1]
MNMDKYLEDLEDYRRQLENMNDTITDADMASIVLTGVEGTHRSVVRMFNRDDEPSNLERVLNTLRGEAEMDQADEEKNGDTKNKEESSKIGAVKGKKFPKGKKQNRVGQGKKAQGGGAWKETRECFHCKKKGHLRHNWRKFKAEQAAKKR